MIWHWAIFIVLVFLTFIEQFTKVTSKQCRTIIFIFTLLCIILSTIRWEQNIADWQGYYKIFCNLKIKSFFDIFQVTYWAFEPIEYMVMRLIKYFTNNYILFQLFMAVIAIGIFYKGAIYIDTSIIINNCSLGTSKSNIISAYLVFWSTTFANVYTVRTNLAVAVCVFSLKYIEKKELIKFIIAVIVATCLHFSALIFLIAYFFYWKKLNIKTVIISLIMVGIVGIIGIDKFISAVSLLGGRYAEKVARYNYYNGTSNFAYYSYSTLFLIIRSLANSGLVLFASCFIKIVNKERNKRFDGMMNLYFVGVLLQIMTITYNIEFARISIFFQSFQYFLLPYIVRVFKKNNFNKLMTYFFLIGYMAVKMYSLYNREPGYMKFSTILSSF